MSQGAAGPVCGGREGHGHLGETGLYWGTALARMALRGAPVPAGLGPEPGPRLWHGSAGGQGDPGKGTGRVGPLCGTGG